jgi:hypothetical protein
MVSSPQPWSHFGRIGGFRQEALKPALAAQLDAMALAESLPGSLPGTSQLPADVNKEQPTMQPTGPSAGLLDVTERVSFLGEPQWTPGEPIC